MKKISPYWQRWLKCLHITFAAAWVGAGLTLATMITFLTSSNANELHGMFLAMQFLDDFIIIPSALGTLVTGIFYSVFTKWGWFKFKWIVVKWIITLYGILFGTFFLGPWLNSIPSLIEQIGIDVLGNKLFITTTAYLIGFGLFQVTTLIFATFISVLKPWNKKNPV